MRYIKTLAGDLYPIHYSTGKELYEQLYQLPLEIKCIQQCKLFYDDREYFPLAEEHPPDEAVIDLLVIPRYHLPDVSITAEEREYYSKKFVGEPGIEYLVWIDNKEMKGLCLYTYNGKNVLYHSYSLEKKIPVSDDVAKRLQYFLSSISK